MKNNYFSINKELIIIKEKIPFDIFINSSTLNKTHFVKIIKKNDILTVEEIDSLHQKYTQFYLHEQDRLHFLKSLNKIKQNYVLKTQLIKNLTLNHLNDIFTGADKSLLKESLVKCQESVEAMVELISNNDINRLKDIIAQLNFHDSYTYDHSMNVSVYSMSIFKMKYPECDDKSLVIAGLAGLLHDIGKTKISTEILNNAGKLSEIQYDKIKKHPIYGYDLLSQLDISQGNCEYCLSLSDYDQIKSVVLEHHENVNGTGYPFAKGGEEIKELSKIIAIADFFDAITTKRSYHEALPINEALTVMKNSVDKKIDKELFELFQKNIKKDIFEGRNLQVPDNFDPCQPQGKLPLTPCDVKFKINLNKRAS